MDPRALDTLHLMLGIGFHGLFAAVITTLGWSLVLFLTLHRAYPDRGWGLAFEFWGRVLTLSFALWALSGLSLWLHPVQGALPPLPGTAVLALVALGVQGALLAALLCRRHVLSPRVQTGLTMMLATSLTVGGLIGARWVLPATVGGDSVGKEIMFEIARSAAITGMLLSGLSALRCLLGDRQPDVRYGLLVGLTSTIVAGMLTLGLVGVIHQPGFAAAPLAVQAKATTAAVLTLASLAMLYVFSTRAPNLQTGRRLPTIVLAGFAALGLLSWIGFTLVQVGAQDGGAALWSALPALKPTLLAQSPRPVDPSSFVTYAVLYAGLTGTYFAGLALMARARATDARIVPIRYRPAHSSEG